MQAAWRRGACRLRWPCSVDRKGDWQGNDWQRNKKKLRHDYSPANHSAAASGPSQEQVGRQKNGVKKIRGSYIFAPIFLPLSLVLLFLSGFALLAGPAPDAAEFRAHVR